MKRLLTFSEDFLSRCWRAIALACLVSVMGWLMVANQPAYAAAAKGASAPPVDQVMTEEPRDQAYEKAVEVIEDPNGVQKTYQENLKHYRQENPDQGGVVEGAKSLLEKITPGDK